MVTPGKWQAALSDPREPEGEWEVFVESEDDDAPPVFIAEFLTPANARLIAAAPDLLDALRIVTGWLEGAADALAGEDEQDDEDCREVVAMARAALAKAEPSGSQPASRE
jgi:hypothetical protein